MVLAMGCSVALAAVPPELINYQGVLRDSDDIPLDGSHGMAFRFFDDPTAGNEILVDTHAAVTVNGGLFNVQLGGGTVTDGTGPGIYASLAQLFADYPDLHLEVQVGGETLSPRIQLTSIGSSLNTHYVRGVELVSNGPVDLFVNAATGNDLNDGTSPERAKQTIQGAVQIAPWVVDGMVTIHIADGVYREQLWIDRRLMRGGGWIILQGNEANPENVVLDGENERDDGIMVLGIAQIRGLHVTNFTEEGMEVGLGWMMVENCLITNNGSAAPWYAGIAVYRGQASISNTAIINNANLGLDIDNAARVEVEGTCLISGNGSDGIRVYTNSIFDGSCVIQENGGIGVRVKDNSMVRFNGDSSLVIQGNTGGSMQASYHSTIRGYGNGTIGSCVEVPDTYSICEP